MAANVLFWGTVVPFRSKSHDQGGGRALQEGEKGIALSIVLSAGPIGGEHLSLTQVSLSQTNLAFPASLELTRQFGS